MHGCYSIISQELLLPQANPPPARGARSATRLLGVLAPSPLLEESTMPSQVTITFEPTHYNPRCGCEVPAAWVAYVGKQKWPCGDTRDEAIANVKREYPKARIIYRQYGGC